ncbi:NAD-dependent epimerase/dehydratase family protein [Chondrinema litorale]|uniref:NAD-dependent epimerase/dehydratase family protein n=1 Tax=Chondrinema litorale TaxID=2994555 RepID=UPI00254273D1|nr:NAD-dependent epimerase/dehydratase family protein [Chondrinema litorale]UZR95488.1 NAD-dependent epimerase/dehydratase family protein [Chondrinema litorale]
MVRILITGFTGFIGHNLLPHLLSKNIKVDGVSRKKVLQNISVYKYDELTVELLNKYDVIIHLAGKAHDLKNSTNESEYFKINSGLTKKMYDLFLKSDAKKFIFLSTVKAAKDRVDGFLVEDVTPDPKTAYGKSKLAAENYILSQNLEGNKSFYILRPCMIHGPGNKGNLNLLYSFVKKGMPYPLAAFENHRSFLSVDNLLWAIDKIISTKVKSGVYNLADNSSISSNYLYKLIAETLGLEPRIIQVPKSIIRLLGYTGDILPFLPINSHKLQKLTENYCVSNAKFISEVQSEFPVTLEQGLIKTINSFEQ